MFSNFVSDNLIKWPIYFIGVMWVYGIVYYESRKREVNRRLISEGRSDERLKSKVEESSWLTYTGLNDKTN